MRRGWRERDKDRDRETDRHRHRQTDRQIERGAGHILGDYSNISAIVADNRIVWGSKVVTASNLGYNNRYSTLPLT